MDMKPTSVPNDTPTPQEEGALAQNWSAPTSESGPSWKLAEVGGKPEVISDTDREYISNGMQLIHSDEMSKLIVDTLRNQDDVTALADLTLKIVDRLDASMEGSKHKVSEETIFKGATVFMDQLVQVGKASGTIEAKEEDIKKAAGIAVGNYIKNGLASGKISEDKMRETYKAIMAKNGGKPVLFDPSQTPGVRDSTVPIPMTSPKPSALGGA